jgi:beta-1,4-mannosyl-glycoprotein beta-1,4-N-acetylglucosaminyltransferase
MRVFDCFTFFNELDVLELRLRELNDLVDRFVLVEGDQTFTGKPKPLVFERNKERFQRFLPKIAHVKFTDFPVNDASPWTRETLSRQAIMLGLFEAEPNDLVLISDVDEIPKPDALDATFSEASRRLTVFETEGFEGYLNVSSNQVSIVQSPRMLAKRFLRDPQSVRSLKPRVSKNPAWRPITEALSPIIRPARTWAKLGYPLPIHIEPRAAWHFTNMGGAESIRSKLLAYSHTENAVEEIAGIDNLKSCLEGARSVHPGTRLSHAPLSVLPSTIRNEPGRWANCLAPARPI